MIAAIVLGIYALMSVITLMTFAVDKRAASRRTWRVRESTLHVMELLGGWPGELLGQRLLRHKTIKRSYHLTLWLIILLHGAGWTVFAWMAVRN